MITEIIKIDPDSIDSYAIERAAAVLRQGGLAAFPTETVYGLGANALDSNAVTGIYRAKGRPSNNPIIVHVPDVASANQLVSVWTETADQLAEQFWPGPLTLVLPRSELIPNAVTGGGNTVGIRIPAHPVALALLKAAKIPIAAPSANRSLMLSPTRAEHVFRDLSGRIAIILDGGPTQGGVESTVLNLSVDPPQLLRPGLISPSQLEAVIGFVARIDHTHDPNERSPLLSPGMLARHYSPRAPLEIYEHDAAKRVKILLIQSEHVGWLTFGSRQPQSGLIIAKMPGNPVAYASALYATLHEMDEANVTRIIVEFPPDAEEWLAVRDRLRRAATP